MAPNLPPLLEWLETLDLRAHPDVQERARLLLLDTVACATAGLTKPEPSALAERLSSLTPGGCGWPGHRAKLASVDSAFVGAMAASWDEACEGLALAHGRPGLHAVPVAVSLGTALERNLGDVLSAIVTGYEIGGRFGASLRIRDRMHVDGTWGLFASTATACAIFGASRSQTCHALASAACQLPCSLYRPVAEGCTTRTTYAGHAAVVGIQLAMAALAGTTAPEGAFDDCNAVLLRGEAGDWKAFDDQSRFYLLEGYLKPFAAVRHVHYPASCAIQWRKQRGERTPEDIDTIKLETYEEAITYCGNRAPTSAIQAQFSLSYGTAHALRTGELGPGAYLQASLADPEQQRLERMVEVTADPAMQSRGARLRVGMGDRIERFEVSGVLGDPGNPMTTEQVAMKAMNFMVPAIGEAEGQRLIEFLLQGDLAARFHLETRHGS
ncbi:MAG: MmgE/PrpD family protein [Gammaproteobacteria bacterium]|nr:MmgE/PrpD family protein [Gammaproteobacteria bacterium]